jgi:hypothetical protein
MRRAAIDDQEDRVGCTNQQASEKLDKDSGLSEVITESRLMGWRAPVVATTGVSSRLLQLLAPASPLNRRRRLCALGHFPDFRISCLEPLVHQRLSRSIARNKLAPEFRAPSVLSVVTRAAAMRCRLRSGVRLAAVVMTLICGESAELPVSGRGSVRARPAEFLAGDHRCPVPAGRERIFSGQRGGDPSSFRGVRRDRSR